MNAHTHALPSRVNRGREREEGGGGRFVFSAQLNLESTNAHMHQLADRPLGAGGG